MTQQNITTGVKSRYRTLLKSCRNIVSNDDIALVRKAFDALREKSGQPLAESDLLRLLDIGLIVTNSDIIIDKFIYQQTFLCRLTRRAIVPQRTTTTIERDVAP